MMAQSRAESTRDTYNYGQYINQFRPNTIKVIREFERIQKKICRHKMSIMFYEIFINEEMLPKYICIYIYIYTQKKSQDTFSLHHHHHHVVLVARIFLTLSRHFSLSFIALGRSSEQHPVSSQSCWIYVGAGRPAFARPCVGVHKSTSLMSSSLLLQQCPACVVRLTWIVFVIGGRWPYSWCLVGVLPPGLVQDCSQHSCVIAV